MGHNRRNWLLSWNCAQTILPKHAITVLTLFLLNPDISSLENNLDPDQLALLEAS